MIFNNTRLTNVLLPRSDIPIRIFNDGKKKKEKTYVLDVCIYFHYFRFFLSPLSLPFTEKKKTNDDVGRR